MTIIAKGRGTPLIFVVTKPRFAAVNGFPNVMQELSIDNSIETKRFPPPHKHLIGFILLHGQVGFFNEKYRCYAVRAWFPIPERG